MHCDPANKKKDCLYAEHFLYLPSLDHIVIVILLHIFTSILYFKENEMA